VSQNDTDQQLRIWKDLAISKQMLMAEAASVLKLKDDFTGEDLKAALNTAVKRAREADDDMANTKKEAEAQIADMEATVKKTEKARKEADQLREDALSKQEQAEQQLGNGRRENAEALKKAKRQVEDKQKELKAINQALADTPENIVKKLKALKKQKLDENVARKSAEDANRVLKKENKEKTEELDTLKDLSGNSAKLLEAYRELRQWSDNASTKLKEASVEVDDVPDIDASVLAGIEAITDDEVESLEAATA